MPTPPQNLNDISSLIQLIKDLRGPEGCPWDKEQTRESLTPYLIEECYELVEAFQSQNVQHICEELGDVLFQIVLHSEMASEKNEFSFQDVVQVISEKIIRRHPHVFADVKVNSSEDVIRNWQNIKKLEKKNKPQPLFKNPKAFPALLNAVEIGEKARALNFDWSTPFEVEKQVLSEIEELRKEYETLSLKTELSAEQLALQLAKQKEKIKDELGDVLFSVAQLARHLDIDPEEALLGANHKFLNRFNEMLSQNENNTEKFKNLSDQEKELFWKKAKQKF